MLCRKQMGRLRNRLEIYGGRTTSERLLVCGSLVRGHRLEAHL